MQDKNRLHHPLPVFFLIIGSLLLALTVTLIFAARSTPDQTLKAEVALQVHIGFDGRYKDGSWIPVYATLSNNGADFSGTLSITPPPSLSEAEWPPTSYQSAITLPTGSQKQVTLYIPLKSDTQATTQTLNVQLLDAHGHLILTRSAFIHALNPQDIFVGLLSDQPDNFSSLSSIDLPNHNATLVTEPLDASTFPTKAAALANFDLLVLDNFTSSTLNDDQLRALQAWIQSGGTLVEVGGPSWQRSLSSLPANLLPVTITTTSLLSNPISSLSINDAPSDIHQSSDQNAQNPVLISIATLSHTPANAISSVILSQGPIPLMVQRQQGLGTLYYLAFDPTLEPLASWTGIHAFWQSLLLRTLGSQFLPPNTGAPILPANGTIGDSISNLPLIGMGMEDLLDSLLPRTLPIPWILLGVLLAYLLVLGPLRFLILRFTRRRWNWRIVLTGLVVFSCLSYSLAIHEKNAAIVSNSISILQLNQNSTLAHMTTYTGIFLPDQGSFAVGLPGSSLTQTLPKTISTDDTSSQPVHIVTSEQGTTLHLNGANTWTMHTIISEQDQQVNGSVIPHLTLDHTTISGTITNTLPYSLTDSYILLGKSYIHSGPLMAHQTRTLLRSLKSTSDPLETLADQITSDGGLSNAYNLNTTLLQTKSPSDLHLETLTALSGELSSFTCGLNICVAGTQKAPQLFGNPLMFSSPGNDPLLLTNTPATFIAWADQQPDATTPITVNGTAASGTHETLLQIPLTIQFPDASSVPPHTLSTHLIDVQGNNILTQPGIFLMTTGSITFEIPVTPTMNVERQPLSVSLLPYPPTGIYQLENTTIRTIADAQHLHVSLYNWHTHTWDTTPFNQYTLLVKQQAYVGPGQRILFKLTNHDASQGTFVLGTPVVVTS